MSVGPLTLIQGVGGREQTKVVEGDDDGIILISQENKVLAMKVSESAILHSWYSSPNQTIIAARKNQDTFDNCSCVVAYDERTVARVNKLGSKLAAFEKTRLNKNVFDLLPVKGDFLVIFVDGTISSLKGLIKGHEERSSEDWYSPAVLDTGTDVLLDSYLLEDGPVASIVFIFKSGDQLKLCHGRLGSGGEGEKPVLSSLQFSTLGNFHDFLSWDLYTGTPSYLLLWKKSGEIMYSEDVCEPSWRTIYTEKNTYDAEICALSKDYCAVVFSKHEEDGGSLKIISLQFQLVSSEAALKTTIHKGRGLFYVNDYLFIVGGGRVAFGSVTQLNKQLDQYIGLGLNSLPSEESSAAFGALSLYQTIPKMYESGDLNKIVNILTTSQDVPEDLIVDFVDHVTADNNQLTMEERQDYLTSVLNIEVSYTVLAGEISRLPLQQALSLLELICTILEDSTIHPSAETRLLKWLDLILSNNYVHTVVAKDENTLAVIEAVYQRLLRLEEELEAATSLASVLEALPTLNFTQHSDINQPYSIQIKHL